MESKNGSHVTIDFGLRSYNTVAFITDLRRSLSENEDMPVTNGVKLPKEIVYDKLKKLPVEWQGRATEDILIVFNPAQNDQDLEDEVNPEPFEMAAFSYMSGVVEGPKAELTRDERAIRRRFYNTKEPTIGNGHIPRVGSIRFRSEQAGVKESNQAGMATIVFSLKSHSSGERVLPSTPRTAVQSR